MFMEIYFPLFLTKIFTRQNVIKSRGKGQKGQLKTMLSFCKENSI